MQMSMRKLNSHTVLFCKTIHCGVVAICNINFCILALGSGQRLLYRSGSGLRLVLVLRCNATVLHVSPIHNPNSKKSDCRFEPGVQTALILILLNPVSGWHGLIVTNCGIKFDNNRIIKSSDRRSDPVIFRLPFNHRSKLNTDLDTQQKVVT